MVGCSTITLEVFGLLVYLLSLDVTRWRLWRHICKGLKSISSLNLTNILVETDCLEVVRLLNDVAVDMFEVSFFIDEAKNWGCGLNVISFSHVRRSQNMLVHHVAQRTLEEHQSSFLLSPYLE